MNKLLSRKFILAIIGAILPVINQFWDLKIPAESVYTIIAYLFSQAYVDGKKEMAKKYDK